MAGVTGLEPAASGVTGRCLRVIWGKMVAFMLNAYHGLRPIPTQKLAQTCTALLYRFIMPILPALNQQQKSHLMLLVRPHGDEGHLAPSLLYSEV